MAKSEKFMTFHPGSHDVPLSQKHEDSEVSILDLGLKAKLDIDHTCGGYGTCGTCLVFVEQGLELFEERNDIEAEFAQDRSLAAHERLACQNNAQAGIVVTVPHKKHLYKSR